MKFSTLITTGYFSLHAVGFGAIYARRVLHSFRNRGLRTTLALIVIEIKSILELLVPRMIWGERVGLRSAKSPLTEAEIERVYKWRHDEEILRWSGGKPSELSLDEFRNQLRRKRWRPESNQRVYYIVTTSGELIGTVGLYSIDWTKCEGEIGTSIDKSYWNMHYGRDAVNLFIRFIFTETPIKRIYLGTFKDNIAAQKIANALGFREIGVESRYNPILGRYESGVKMEITRQEFR